MKLMLTSSLTLMALPCHLPGTHFGMFSTIRIASLATTSGVVSLVLSHHLTLLIEPSGWTTKRTPILKVSGVSEKAPTAFLNSLVIHWSRLAVNDCPGSANKALTSSSRILPNSMRSLISPVVLSNVGLPFLSSSRHVTENSPLHMSPISQKRSGLSTGFHRGMAFAKRSASIINGWFSP